MFRTILVVCRGNICRSPVAEAMLRKHVPHCRVSSAGITALVGEGVEPTARQLAEADGFEVSEHRARQLDADLLAGADLVLVMSDDQRREIASRWPEVLGKTMRLGHWLEQSKGQDIPDPYCRSEAVFLEVHRLISRATREWAGRL